MGILQENLSFNINFFVVLLLFNKPTTRADKIGFSL